MTSLFEAMEEVKAFPEEILDDIVERLWKHLIISPFSRGGAETRRKVHQQLHTQLPSPDLS